MKDISGALKEKIDSHVDQYKSINLDGKVLQKEDLREVLNDLIDYNLLCFSNYISLYDKENLFDMAGRMTRGVEEFINLVMEFDRFPELSIFPIGEFGSLKELDQLLYQQFEDKKLVGRLINVYVQLIGLKEVCTRFGIDLQFNTIGEAIAYLHSRRAYLQTFQPLILLYSKGKDKIEPKEPIIFFFPALELYLMRIGFLTDCFPPSYCLEDYSIRFTGEYPNLSLEKNYHYDQLEGPAYVPLRIPAMDLIYHLNVDQTNLIAPKKSKNKIFSYSELEATPQYWKVLFSEYGLEKCEKFNKYSELFLELKPNLLHDYFIVINKADLMKKIETIFGDNEPDTIFSSLVLPSDDFLALLNSKNPFVAFGESLYSNVNYLNRYLLFIADDYLNSVKKYQVNSGFVFEKIITKLLIKYDFEVRDIKRVKNSNGTFSEFDVIAIKNGQAYNFQCKNNIIDISNVKLDLIGYAHRNDALLKQYQDAYKKELNRESMLMENLKVSKIHHLVISRYPIITRLEYIITFQKFEEWLSRW